MKTHGLRNLLVLTFPNSFAQFFRSLGHHWSCISFIIVSMLLFSPSDGLATTIVAVRTPEVVAIASDSEGTFRGGTNQQSKRSVAKIFQKGGVLYAISGLTKDPRRGFDSEEIVSNSLLVTQSLWSVVTNIETTLGESLKNVLSKHRIEEPVLFREELKGDNPGTSVLLATFENGAPIAIGIRFLGEIDTEGKITVRTKRLACPGDCVDGKYTFFLGQRKAIDKYVAKLGKRFAMPPEEAVRFMVQLEIDANTPGVGPPVDVVRLNKDGINWLTRKTHSK